MTLRNVTLADLQAVFPHWTVEQIAPTNLDREDFDEKYRFISWYAFPGNHIDEAVAFVLHPPAGTGFPVGTRMLVGTQYSSRKNTRGVAPSVILEYITDEAGAHGPYRVNSELKFGAYWLLSYESFYQQLKDGKQALFDEFKMLVQRYVRVKALLNNPPGMPPGSRSMPFREHLELGMKLAPLPGTVAVTLLRERHNKSKPIIFASAFHGMDPCSGEVVTGPFEVVKLTQKGVFLEHEGTVYEVSSSFTGRSNLASWYIHP